MSDDKSQRGKINTVFGEVVSDKMNKTISVKISRLVKHERYGKYLKTSSVFKAHDEQNSAKIGDKVEIASSRPYSKTKRWKLVRVISSSTMLD